MSVAGPIWPRERSRRDPSHLLAGAAVGALIPIGRPLLGMLFAFLSGGIVLNVIKEELPDERDSRFLPFLVGSAAYSALLLAA